MMPQKGRTRRWLLLMGILGVATACRDAVAPRALRPPDPSAIIVDGAHNNGNDDVFFLPPMVADPSSATGFGDPEQLGLPVEIQVNCLSKASTSSCPNFDFQSSMVKSSSDAHYMVNWDTKSLGVDPGDIYRVEVHIGIKTLAWADVAILANANPKNMATQGDIPLPDGRTLPIKIRIEKGWDCTNRTNKNQCVTQVVPNVAADGSGSTIVQFPGTDLEPAGGGRFYDGWIPYSDNCQAGSTSCVPTGTPVVVTVEDQTSLLNASGATCSLKDPKTGVPVTTMLTQLGTGATQHPGRCVKFTTSPKFQFAARVDVAVCVESPTPTQQLLKYDIGETPRFLQNVFFPIVCEPSTIGSTMRTRSTNAVVNYALNTISGAGRALSRFFTPKSAYAIHLGVGGLIPPTGDGGGFSFVAPAEPYTTTKISGDGQSGTVRTAVAGPQLRMTTVHPSLTPAVGQSVRCDITPGGGNFVSLDGPTQVVVQTQPVLNANNVVVDAVATCPAWYLGPDAGVNNNSVRMVALTIDDGITAREDDGEGGVLTETLHGIQTFTATALSGAPVLSSPADGAQIAQNVAAAGCQASNTAGYGYRVPFQWNAVAGATQYHVVAQRTGSELPVVDAVVPSTSYLLNGCGSYIIDSNLNGWSWQVQATVNGQSTPFSTARTFSFAPCRHPDQSACGTNYDYSIPHFVDVSLGSTTFEIGGASVSYLTTVLDPSTSPMSLVFVQAYVKQGDATRAAGGSDVTCDPTPGELPVGSCKFAFSTLASNATQIAGNGTLIPGAATWVLELHFQNGDSADRIVETRQIPITLVNAP